MTAAAQLTAQHVVREGTQTQATAGEPATNKCLATAHRVVLKKLHYLCNLFTNGTDYKGFTGLPTFGSGNVSLGLLAFKITVLFRNNYRFTVSYKEVPCTPHPVFSIGLHNYVLHNYSTV